MSKDTLRKRLLRLASQADSESTLRKELVTILAATRPKKLTLKQPLVKKVVTNFKRSLATFGKYLKNELGADFAVSAKIEQPNSKGLTPITFDLKAKGGRSNLVRVKVFFKSPKEIEYWTVFALNHRGEELQVFLNNRSPSRAPAKKLYQSLINQKLINLGTFKKNLISQGVIKDDTPEASIQDKLIKTMSKNSFMDLVSSSPTEVVWKTDYQGNQRTKTPSQAAISHADFQEEIMSEMYPDIEFETSRAGAWVYLTAIL